MMPTTVQLSFENQPDEEAEDAARVGRALREALLALSEVERADFAPRPPEAGTKGLTVDVTTLLVALVSSGALTAVVAAVQAWVMRNHGRTAKLKLGEDVLELTGLSRDQQDKAIQVWLARQRGFDLP